MYEEFSQYGFSNDDSGINGYINALYADIKNLQNMGEKEEYLSRYRQMSLQVSSGNYTSLQRQISNTYATQLNYNMSVGLSNDCILCFNSSKKIVFRPCSHLVCCKNCAKKILTSKQECPICKTKINNIHEIIVPDTINNFICQKCKNCHINSFNIPCKHASVCKNCNVDNCCTTCQKKVERVIVFKSS